MIASTASTMMMITSLLEPLILMLNGYLEAQHLDYFLFASARPHGDPFS
jgi:hypothetical protein